MKTIRCLLILFLSGLGFAPAALSADAPASAEQQLVGIWEEYEPDSNVVQFYPNHTLRLYLTQDEGSKMQMHWLEGTWTVSPESVLTLSFTAGGKSLVRSIKLVFEDKEMWLVEGERHTTTKHRRLTGDIPKKYRW